MIKEAYCSFEVSKLLKEKGFDEPCWIKYDNEGYLTFNHVGYINSEKPCDDFCALAPTHQMAMAWLREVHNIFIVIRRGLTGTGWVYSHEIYKDSKCWYAQYAASYDTYEEAVEAALKYSLENLI